MKKIIMILTMIILNTFAANAVIIYTDIIPDSTISPIGQQYQQCYFLDLDNSKNHQGWGCDFVIAHNNPSPEYGHPYVDIFCSDELRCEIICNDKILFIPLNKNDMINKDSKTWCTKEGIAINSTSQWKGAVDKYIGLRMLKGNKWYYGWARMDIPLNASKFVIKDYAYNNTPNEGILAGQTTNSSSIEYPDIKAYFISPNPVEDFIRLPHETCNKIEIFNIAGIKVFESDYKEKIDVRSLVPNVYIVKIDDESYKFIKK